MKILINLQVLLALLFLINSHMLAQIKGEQPPEFDPDTVFIFTSPRPLLTTDRSFTELNAGWGLELLFSGNGFGAGVFMQHYFTDDLTGFFSLYISGARNTDEFPEWDQEYRDWRVRDKINRLFMFPVTFGLQQDLLREKLSAGFTPYASVGIGPTFILATPYEKEFFEAFSYGSFYTRFGGFIGFGANLSSNPTSLMTVNVRYYYIPFGGNGLASVKGHEISDFGGVFLSLSIGSKY